MPHNPHADFTPTLKGYSGQEPFRFWCQLALPLTYDDSLSYYELLNKVVTYLNHTIEDVSNMETNVGALHDAYVQLQSYVNDYFDNIDIEAELRSVLDKMALDGSLDALLDPLVANHLPEIVESQIDDVVAEQIDGSVERQIGGVIAEQLPPLVDENIPNEVSDWLEENVDPVGSAVIVDSSLTISGAAADAKVTGDELSELKTQLNVQRESIFNTPYVPSNMSTTNGAIKLYKGRVQYATGKIVADSSGKYYRTQYGGVTQYNLLLIGEHPLTITLGLDWVEWNCWSYSGTTEDEATHSNTGEKYINGADPIYISAEYPDIRFGFSIRKVGASDEERTAFTDEELSIVRNAIKFWVVPDASLSIIGALADAGSVGNAFNKLRDNIGCGISLETIAYNNKTYADVFFGEYNVASPFYFDSGTISPAKVNAGNPVIAENSDYTTGGHNVLKCFGSSSQIRIAAGSDIIHFTQNHAYFCALCVNVPRYSAGKAGMNILKTGVFDYALSKQSTTYGWEILSDIYTYTKDSAAVTCYLGTFNSANADVLIAMPVVIDVTALGIDTSMSDKINEANELMKRLYINYLAITDTPEIRRRRVEVKSRKFAATTMDATSTVNRFLALKELFDVARKKYVNPYYIPKLNESPELVKGTVCALPPDNAAFYEKYSFNKLYSVDDSVQAYPASTTKVLSIITAMPYILNVYDKYTLESDDIKASSGNSYYAGDILTIRDLLFSMLLESSNTSATALGTYCGRKILQDESASHSDAQAAFVAAMNEKASEIGCTGSNFVNPSGMGRVAVSTCDDLLRILIDGSSYTDILRIWNKKTYTTTIGGSNSRSITITTSVANATLENDYYIFGGKTGALDNGPYTLIMIAEAK